MSGYKRSTIKFEIRQCGVYHQWSAQYCDCAVSNTVPFSWVNVHNKQKNCQLIIQFIVCEKKGTTEIQLPKCSVYFQWFKQWSNFAASNSAVCWFIKNGMVCYRMRMCYFVLTTHIEISECGIGEQWTTQCNCSRCSKIVTCQFVVNGEDCRSCFHSSVLLFVFTMHVKFLESLVFLQYLTQCYCSPFFDLVVCWFDMKKDNDDGFLLFRCLLHRLSLKSVVFFINDSLRSMTPLSPMMSPVCYCLSASEWTCFLFYHCFLLCSPRRLSLVSVVFVFNASLNILIWNSLRMFTVDRDHTEMPACPFCFKRLEWNVTA